MSENVAVQLDVQVGSTGPATTAPFASTIVTAVSGDEELSAAVDVAKVTTVEATVISSPRRSTMYPPRGWFGTLIAMFCAGTSFAFEIVVAAAPVTVIALA